MKHETYERRLKSGARLAVVHVPGSPIFELETVVNSGHRFAAPGQYELPHLLEHLAFEGSTKYPDPQAFNYEVERYGIYHNAWTTVYRNGYVFYGAMEYWQHIINLGMEQLLHPLFKPTVIKQQKEVIVNELTGRMNSANSKAGYYLYRQLKNGLVLDWPERIQTLQRTKRSDIVEFYERLYHPHNFIHLVTGDLPKVRVDELAEMLDTAMAASPRRIASANDSIIPAPPQQSVHIIDYPYAETAAFSMSLFRPGFDQEHYAAMRIFSTMLSGGTYSLLHQKARAAGLSYSVDANYGTSSESSELDVWDQTQPQHIVPLIKLVLDEITNLTRGNFSDQDLERAVGYEVGRHAVRFQTAMAVAGWYSDVYLDDLPLRKPDEVPDEYRAVTRAQIREAASQYFARDNPNRYLVVASQKDDSAELEDILASFGV